MAGLPSELFNALQWALVECEVFESPSSLRSFFERESLRPWRNTLPEGTNVHSRVAQTIALLVDKRRASGVCDEWYDGQSALAIFLGELWLYYNSGERTTPEKVRQVMEALLARGRL